MQMFNIINGLLQRQKRILLWADGLARAGYTQAEISIKEGRPYTLHECNDMKAMQLIPSEINKYFGHMGGVGEINLYFELFSSKPTWGFRNWKKWKL